MKEINLEELKELELNILIAFRDICDQNGFKYSLCGGTLLGAVRHKGFIPWDDDIDVFMPRPDYEAFIAYSIENKLPFKVVASQTEPDFYDLSTKLINTDTILNERETNLPSNLQGVYIDVFPIDGLGKTKECAVRQFNKTRFDRELLTASQWKHFFKSKTHPWYYEPIRFSFFLLSRTVNKKRLVNTIEKIEKEIPYDSADFCGCICGSYRLKEIMPYRVFSELKEIKFESFTFKAPQHYDYYLRQVYGDYMKLPPEDKRKSHHLFKAYWKD